MKSTGKFISSNSIDFISYYIYTPQTEPKAIVQLSHGMCEYIERYEPFIEFLNNNGIIVCGNDHLGHGKSVSSNKLLGYFADKNGYTYLPKDLHRLTIIVKDLYPDIPYFMLGHSMGSFAARAYLIKYSKYLDGAIVAGTSGQHPSRFVLFIIKLVIMFKGNTFRSKFIDKLLFGSYNNRFSEKRTKFDWLTRDNEIVDKYMKDVYCNFLFTTSGYYDLISLLRSVSSKQWFGKFPSKLPVLLLSGDMDPVGNYGKGVRNLFDKLKTQSNNVELKLFSQCRHEILNETNRNEIYKYILNWMYRKIDE